MSLVVDNFAGGGGASLGIERALGRPVDIAVNHDAAAILMHRANHPRTLHLCEDVWEVDPLQVCGNRPVDIAWFSPDCKHFSRAKGAKPVSRRIRGLAWVAVRWAQLKRPRLIFLENVREFQDWGPLVSDRPDPQRKGFTFLRFVARLRNLGYALEWRILDGADFGAPTHRRRLVLIARCDGRPIAWPEPTHGPGRARPWRTAAECIDWSLPCPSIFERRKPLAEKTLRRIALGIKRYVLDCPHPFIVRCAHGEGTAHTRRWGRGSQAIEEPLPTITGSNDACVVTPFITHVNHGGPRKAHAPDAALPTITAAPRGELALVSPLLISGYGERARQAPRSRSIEQPAPTPVASSKHALVAAFLTQFRGSNRGNGGDVTAPLPTITSQGTHVAEVRAFLVKYFATACGQPVTEPLHTVTSRHRFGLVTVNGDNYQIVDIGLRMLTPRELARAQGFPDNYELTGTKTNQVAKIGNSVCPAVAEAVVRANAATATLEAVG